MSIFENLKKLLRFFIKKEIEEIHEYFVTGFLFCHWFLESLYNDIIVWYV
jgi:hypothetical protein